MKLPCCYISVLIIGCVQVNAAAPANTLFAGREYVELAHGVAMVEGVVSHAATEPFEPGNGYRSLWWEVIAPEDGILRIQTTSAFLHYIEVYEGVRLDSLKTIWTKSGTAYARNHEVQIRAASGTRMTIRTATYYADQAGAISTGLYFDSTAPISFVPLTGRTSHDNDNLARHQTLEGFQASGSGFLTSARSEPFESGSGSKSLWWGWTAPATGMLHITTDGSDDLLKYLSVWIGDEIIDLRPLQLLGYERYPVLSLPVAAGQEYKFRISAYSAAGMGTAILNLNLDTSDQPISTSRFRSLPKANSGSFANRAVLTGTHLSSLVYTLPANPANEALEKGSGSRSCWWEWTVPTTGTYTVTTHGSDTNHKYLSVLHGHTFHGMEFLMPESPYSAWPSLSFTAEEGMRLFIRSAYYSSGSSGHILLTITGEDDGESPTITNWMHANAQVGEGFYFRIQARNQPDSYAAFGLPAGLTLNTATGEITGRPEYAGTFPVSLVARKGAMESTAVLRLTVAPVAAAMVDAITPVFSGFVYTPDMGWVFTNWRIYPFLYDFERETWLYFYDGSANPRKFWNVLTDQMEERP